MNTAAVLVVEDDKSLREALCDTLEMAGISVAAVSDGGAALKVIDEREVAMVVSDVHMQPMDGYSLMQKLKSKNPNLPVVLMTAYGNIEKAVMAMRDGASDYLVKPFDAEALINMVTRYVSQEKSTSDLIAEAPQTLKTIALAERVAATEATVMISGESGSGKEVIAQHIHNCSVRRNNPFVAINCAAIPENMLEAVLFGYEKGSFTGAYQSSPGKFEQAQDGTLLLDEISEMDLGLQAKLLRVIQEKEVERLGGRKIIPLNVRILATTNRNLKKEVEAGRFREDLYYRLNVFPIKLLPLRARREDILPLSRFFINKHNGGGDFSPVLSEAAEQKILSHSWPGNVRELENVIQRAIILHNGNEIGSEDINFEIEESNDVFIETSITEAQYLDVDGSESKLTDDLKITEHKLIIDALLSSGSKKVAAEQLGISPRTLRYKLARMREAGVYIPGESLSNRSD